MAKINSNDDDSTIPLITSLASIAHIRGIKEPNVGSWAHAVNDKLSDNGIESMVEIQANLSDLNYKLKANGHTHLHQSTIDALQKHQASSTSPPSNNYLDAPSTYQGASLFEAGNMANNNFVRIVENSGQRPSALLVKMGELKAFGLAASKDPDTLTWGEAMADIDKEKWLEAAQIEIEALESNHTWQEVPKTTAETKIIPGTWVFCRKHTLDGEIGLCAQVFNLTREGNFEEFLGIKINRTEWDAHGPIHMTQQCLIQKTTTYVGMQ
jgi:hypothetical protein